MNIEFDLEICFCATNNNYELLSNINHPLDLLLFQFIITFSN